MSFVILIALAALVSAPFLVYLYLKATPDQRRQILLAAAGAVVVALLMLYVLALR